MKSSVQVGSKVKIVDRNSRFCFQHGTVIKVLMQCCLFCPGECETVGFVCMFEFDDGGSVKVEFRPKQVECLTVAEDEADNC